MSMSIVKVKGQPDKHVFARTRPDFGRSSAVIERMARFTVKHISIKPF